MGGVDYLVPMLYLAVALPIAFGGPSHASRTLKRILLALFAVLLGSLFYLLVLAFAARSSGGDCRGPGGDAAFSILGKCGHVAQTGALESARVGRGNPVRHCLGTVPLVHAPGDRAGSRLLRDLPAVWRPRRAWPAWRRPSPSPSCSAGSRPDVADKKIVFFEKGYVNWLKPEHGQYGQHVGGHVRHASHVPGKPGQPARWSRRTCRRPISRTPRPWCIIYPNEPWKEGQLERIDEFVRGGGSLMVMGEHTVREKDGGSRINDVLAPTAMRVPFDSALFAIGGWLHSYDALAHPTSAGIGDESNQFGVVIGASVEARWPARPLLIGRWGWADLGDASKGDAAKGESMLGNERYDAGRETGRRDPCRRTAAGGGQGDLLRRSFDAHQRPDGGLPRIHLAAVHLPAGRRMHAAGHLAATGRPGRHRVALGPLAVAAPCRATRCWRAAAAAALGLAASLALCTAVTHRAWDVLPDGGWKSPNNLAYIDAGHLNADAPESWREDGLGALQLTLMRNGYLPLLLSKITPERLDKARLLFIDAPAREYSADECRVVRDFARRGGIVIITVGYERAGPSRRLLSTLGFQVGTPADAETADGTPAEKPRSSGAFQESLFQRRRLLCLRPLPCRLARLLRRPERPRG